MAAARNSRETRQNYTMNYESAEGQTPRRVQPRDPSQGLVAVPKNGRLLLIRTDEIDWIDSAGNYAQFHCGSRMHTVRATLATLEARLAPVGFVRLHRSVLVNLIKVKELYPLFRGDFRVVLVDGTELTLKKTYRGQMQRRLLFGCLGSCENEPAPGVDHGRAELSSAQGAT